MQRVLAQGLLKASGKRKFSMHGIGGGIDLAPRAWSSVNANVRTTPRFVSEAVNDENGCETLCWDDIDLPTLVLGCRPEDLHRVTLVIGLYCYSRAGTRKGNSKLRGTVQLQLSPPDKSGHIPLAGAPNFRLQYCASALPLTLSVDLRADIQDQRKRKVGFVGSLMMKAAQRTSSGQIQQLKRSAQSVPSIPSHRSSGIDALSYPAATGNKDSSYPRVDGTASGVLSFKKSVDGQSESMPDLILPSRAATQ